MASALAGAWDIRSTRTETARSPRFLLRDTFWNAAVARMARALGARSCDCHRNRNYPYTVGLRSGDRGAQASRRCVCRRAGDARLRGHHLWGDGRVALPSDVAMVVAARGAGDRATKPGAKRTAALWFAPSLACGFVARLPAGRQVGHSPTAGDAPSSRLATGQTGRNKTPVI